MGAIIIISITIDSYCYAIFNELNDLECMAIDNEIVNKLLIDDKINDKREIDDWQ